MNRLCADGRGPGACSESASSAFLDGLLRGDGGGGLPGARVLPLVLAPAPTAYGGHRLGVIFPNKGRCRGAGRGVCVCVRSCLTHHHPFQRAPTFSLTAQAMLLFCFPSHASGNQSPFISFLRFQGQNKLFSLTLNIFFPQ